MYVTDPVRAPRAGLLLLVSATAAASGWAGARLILGEHRPELVGARFSGDLVHPASGMVQIGVGFLVVGAVAAGVLALSSRGDRADRRIVAALIAVVAVVLVAWSGLTRPAERCAYDSYAGTTAGCVSAGAGLLTDTLLVGLPAAITAGCLLAGPRRSRRRTDSQPAGRAPADDLAHG